MGFVEEFFGVLGDELLSDEFEFGDAGDVEVSESSALSGAVDFEDPAVDVDVCEDELCELGDDLFFFVYVGRVWSHWEAAGFKNLKISQNP